MVSSWARRISCVGQADLLFQAARILSPLDDQLPAFQRAADLKQQFLALDRLDKISPGPIGQRLDGRLGIVHGRHHEHGRIGKFLVDVVEQLQPGAARHVNVHHR